MYTKLPLYVAFAIELLGFHIPWNSLFWKAFMHANKSVFKKQTTRLHLCRCDIWICTVALTRATKCTTPPSSTFICNKHTKCKNLKYFFYVFIVKAIGYYIYLSCDCPPLWDIGIHISSQLFTSSAMQASQLTWKQLYVQIKPENTVQTNGKVSDQRQRLTLADYERRHKYHNNILPFVKLPQ